MSMCRVFSCAVGRGCLLWPVHSLGKTLLAFHLFRFVVEGQICLLLQLSFDVLLLHSIPLWRKGHLFLVLDLEGLVGHHRTFNFSFFGISGCGMDLDYCDIEWFSLETNRLFYHFFIFHPSTAFWTFVDYECYSISSKGFLLTVVDIIVIWIKFTHSSSF